MLADESHPQKQEQQGAQPQASRHEPADGEAPLWCAAQRVARMLLAPQVWPPQDAPSKLARSPALETWQQRATPHAQAPQVYQHAGRPLEARLKLEPARVRAALLILRAQRAAQQDASEPPSRRHRVFLFQL